MFYFHRYVHFTGAILGLEMQPCQMHPNQKCNKYHGPEKQSIDFYDFVERIVLSSKDRLVFVDLCQPLKDSRDPDAKMVKQNAFSDHRLGIFHAK